MIAVGCSNSRALETSNVDVFEFRTNCVHSPMADKAAGVVRHCGDVAGARHIDKATDVPVGL